MTSAFLLIAVLFLAAANGANDNFKGVATLWGSRTLGYRASLAWASATTLAGALCSVFIAKALLATFTGKGLVPSAIAGQAAFAAAVAGGAALTVALAAWRGLPISTTHALVGGISGAGLIAAAGAMRFGTLGTTVVLPLIASPLLALVPALLIGSIVDRLPQRQPTPALCACAVSIEVPTPDGSLLRHGGMLELGTVASCEANGATPIVRIEQRRWADGLHVLLAGGVGFARGLNDTPKIAALLLPVAGIGTQSAVAAVGMAMLLGGIVGARRVAHTLSERITSLDLRPALTASLCTSLLVGTASVNGLPVSTTHVSVGALTGAGAAAHGVNRQTLSGILLSWLVTLPVAALFSALIYRLIG